MASAQCSAAMRVGAREVGDGARHPDDAVVAAGREPEALGSRVEQLLRRGGQRAEAPEKARRQLRIGAQAGARQSLLLVLRARASTRARMSGEVSARRAPATADGQDDGQFHVQIDAVEERAG